MEVSYRSLSMGDLYPEPTQRHWNEVRNTSTGSLNWLHFKDLIMAYREYENTESRHRGDRVEDLFGKILNKRFNWWRRATLDEQYQHIDYITPIGSVDVKAMKAVSRGKETQVDLVWVEFQNQAGMTGWLYGAQDFIAFERPDDFAVVNRIKLLDLCKEIVDLSYEVPRSSAALYRSYTRHGKQDILSMIKMSDLFRLPVTLLTKRC